MDCNLPGSSVHGIFQAKVLEWVAISFSRGSSQPRDQTWVSDRTRVSRVAGRSLVPLRDQGFPRISFPWKGRLKKEAIHEYLPLIPIVVQQKLTQYCKAIIRSVMSDSLRPHESQHARPPCPSPTPGVHSDSRPSSQ